MHSLSLCKPKHLYTSSNIFLSLLKLSFIIKIHCEAAIHKLQSKVPGNTHTHTHKSYISISGNV